MEKFKLIIVEDVPLELKGTEGIVRHEIPEAEVIGTADSESAYWRLIKQQQPDLVLLDLGLGGSTTVGVEICRQTKELIRRSRYSSLPVRLSMRSCGLTCSMPVPTVLSSRRANCSPVVMLWL